MRIALDVDNTTTDTAVSMYDQIDKCKYKEELLSRINKIVFVDLNDKYVEHFYEKHAVSVFKNAPLMKDAKDVIAKLKSEGNSIIFITSRGDDNKYYEGTEKITIDFLTNNEIPYDKIIFNTTKKEIECKRENIDILLDDNITFCENVSKEGIRAVVFNSKENEQIDSGNLVRVSSWKEFYDYIKKIET